MTQVQRVSKFVWSLNYVRTAVKLFCLLIILLFGFIAFQNLVWNNRDVIGYSIMNPDNVRKLEVILEAKENEAVKTTFESFPSSVK